MEDLVIRRKLHRIISMRNNSQALALIFIIVALASTATAIFILIISQEHQSTGPITTALTLTTTSPAITSTSMMPPVASKLIYSEDFEDGFAHNFDFYSGGWKVVDDGTGNKVLQMNSPQTCCADARFGPTNLSDGIVEFRFKVISTDYQVQVHVMEFSYRVIFSGGDTQYQLHYDPETSIINTIYQQNGGDWQPLEGNSGEGPIQVQTGNWITLRVEFRKENISVLVNGNPFMTGLDFRINNGSLTLGANGPMIVQFDDLKVWDMTP